MFQGHFGFADVFLGRPPFFWVVPVYRHPCIVLRRTCLLFIGFLLYFEVMSNFVVDFVWKFFLEGGYNIVNTLTYGLVLGFIVFKLIPRLKPLFVCFDRNFMLMLAPYIFFGATMRELVDQDLGLFAGNTQFPQNYMLVSPGIFFSMFSFTLLAIIAAMVFQKYSGINYKFSACAIGSVAALYNLSLILPNIQHWNNLFSVSIFFVLSAVLLYALKKLFNLDFLDFEYNFYIVLAHFFDATTTFVGIDLMHHVEKHVVPNFFIDLVGTAAVMYPLKLLVLIPALYMIDDEVKDDVFDRRFIKFVIVILGLGPGIRNLTLLMMG